jgi:uncharacterized repeat protein (TIGR01451 family)/uncharacterized repeat protein (TIGR02543 family)
VRGFIINDFTADGILITGDGNAIEGCYIGTDVNGTSSEWNGEDGIEVTGDNNTIGGTNAADGNVLSGNFWHGVEIASGGGNRIWNNRIGTRANGSGSLGNQSHGVWLSGSTANTLVGGTGSNEANIIAFNGAVGVGLANFGGTGNSIRGNKIYNNGNLGIDIYESLGLGVNANDAGDPDGGGNAHQNYPVLSLVSVTGASVTIDGSLNSLTSTVFQIDFYSNPVADFSNHGEGEVYLGATNVTTDAGGDVVFSVTLPASVTTGHVVTATATDPGGSTSEFSSNVAAQDSTFELVVVSPFGTPIPAVGTNTYSEGTTTNAVVTDSPAINSTTQHVATGWTGTGDVPATGSTTNTGSFTITQHSSVTWTWKTQFWLDTTATSSGSVDVADGWFDNGSNVTVTATPPVGYHFVNWTGDSSSTNEVLNLIMDAAKTVTANFAIDTFTITPSAGANGSISPGVPVVVPYGSSTGFVITADGTYQIAGVEIDGSSAGVVKTYTFMNVTSNHTVDAFFESIPGPVKPLYLSGPGQDLDRIDPVASGDTSTEISPALGWEYRRKLTFDNSIRSDSLTNFPVLITLTSNRMDYGVTQDSGEDLRFFDGDLTPLAHEIEEWNESGSSYIWVNVPQIDGASSNDFIWMYYGNDHAPGGEDVTSVWDTNYVGVWHLAEDQAGTGQVGLYRDSTGLANDGDDYVAATGQAGRINGAQAFSGAGDRVEVPHHDSLNLDGPMTISFWIRPSEDAGQWNRVVEKGLWGYQTAYYFGGGNGTNDLTFYLDNIAVMDTPDDVLSTNVWQYCAVSYESNGDATMFLDGTVIDSGSYTGAITGNADILYLSYSNATYDFAGNIDEVRIAATGRSADWITAQYASQSDTLVTYGAEEDTLAQSSGTFTQIPVMASDFTIATDGVVTVSAYMDLSTGTLALPLNLTATVSGDGVPFATLGEPAYASVSGTVYRLDWVGSVASNTTIATGQQIALEIGTSEPSLAFELLYDSQDYPSRIGVPAASVISIDALDVYDAAFPGGGIITQAVAGQTVYLRSQVSDPFGTYDITGLDLSMTNACLGTVNTNLNDSAVVSSNAASKVYEWAWDVPSCQGFYDISATAHEGSEGITDTAVASLEHLHTLTVTSPYGTPTPGLGSHTYTNGAPVTGFIPDSPALNGSTQYVATGWTGTGDVVAGSGTNTSFNLTQDSTITWQWLTQYWLDTETAGSGSVDVADGWFDSGTNVIITATPDAGYHFVAWTGDSSSTNPLLNLTIDAAKTVTANFAIDTFTITPTAGANGSIVPAAPVVVAYGGSTSFVITAAANYHIADVLVDLASVGAVSNYTFNNVTADHTIDTTFAIDRFDLTVASAYGTPSPAVGTTTYDYNTLINAVVPDSPLVNGTTQYVATGWTGTGDVVAGSGTNTSFTLTQDSTITWQWLTQYWLDTETAGSGAVDVTDGWFDSGANLTIAATPDVGYHFVNWTGDSSSTNAVLNLTMDAAKSVTANFAIDTFTITPSAGANGSIAPAVPVVVAYGGSTSFVVTAAANYHIAGVLTNGVSAESFTQADTVYTQLFSNVTSDQTIDATFAIDRFNLLISSPYGTPVPAVGTTTFDYDTLVNASVPDAPVVNGSTQYVATGWSGTGDVVAGAGTNTSFNLTQNSTLDWQWKTQYWLNTGVIGSGSVDVADGWYNSGTNVTITATPDVGQNFVNWIGDIGGANPSNAVLSVTMDQARAVTANFAINTFTITPTAGANGSIAPAVPVGVNYGGSTSFVATAAANYHIADVQTNGVSAGAFTQADTVYTQLFSNVTADQTIDATFTIDRFDLVVTSPYGTPSPAVGINTYDYNTLINAGVPHSPVVYGTTQYVATGWTGSGDVPASGSGTNTPILTVTQNSTLDWQWKMQYRLNTGVIGSGSVDVADGWYDSGTNVTITATPDLGQNFLNWFGDIGAADPSNAVLSVTMNQARAVTANFAINTFTITPTAGPNGSVSPSVPVIVPHGGSTSLVVTAAANYHIAGVLTNGVSAESFTQADTVYTQFFSNVTADQTIDATFAIDRFDLVVTSPYGTPSPAVGTNTYNHNTLINAALPDSPVANGTTQYVATGWTGTGDVVAGNGTNTSFNLTQNSTLNWQWQTRFWLDTAVASSGSVDVADGWFGAGTNVTITATPDAGYSFVNWTGDVAGTNPVLNLTMDAAKSVTATFAQNFVDLQILLSVDDAYPDCGTLIAYTVTVTNREVIAATGVEVTDLVPPGVLYQASAASTGVYDAVSGIWTVDTVGANSAESLTITAQVERASACPAPITNVAAVFALNEPDSTASNDAALATIQVTDVTPPSISCPDGQILSADASCRALVPDLTGGTVVSDNCSDVMDIMVTQSPTAGTLIGPGTTVITVTAVDLCANTNQCTVSIDVVDTTAPNLIVPPNVALECGQDSSPATAGTATATDACDASPAVNFWDAVVGSCPAGKTITRTWMAMDSSGNITMADQTITQTIQILDLAVTTMVSDPAPSCGDLVDFMVQITNTSAVAATGVEITDLLPGGLSYLGRTISQGAYDHVTGVWTVGALAGGAFAEMTLSARIDPIAFCPLVITNVATLSALNESDANASNNWQDVVFTVTDVAPPSVTPPPDLVIDCSESVMPTNTGTAFAIDNCDPAPVLSYVDVEAPGCPRVITRTWIATDACGNIASADQRITRTDNTPPVLVVPPDITIECHESIALWNTGNAAATDCIGFPLLSYIDAVTPGACPEERTIVRAWTALDLCGNQTTLDQVITVVDTTAPLLTVPPDVTIECGDSTAPGYTGYAVALDPCYVEISWNDNVASGACPTSSVITRTWTAIDRCGHSVTLDQEVVVVDTTPPALACPPSLTVNGDVSCQVTIPDLTGSVTAPDACAPAGSITITQIPPPGSLAGAGTNIITFTANDGCNTSQCTIDLVVECVLPVIGITVTTDQSMVCPGGEVIYTYALSNNGIHALTNVMFSNVPLAPVIPDNGDIDGDSVLDTNEMWEVYSTTNLFVSTMHTAVVTAVDLQGTAVTNSAEAYVVVDAESPLLSPPPDIAIECHESTAPGNTGLPIADDLFSLPTVTFTDEVAAGGCADGTVITRTWLAVDACGNSETVAQIITVTDTTPPVLTAPPDVTIGCGDSTAPSSTGWATAFDNCSVQMGYSDSAPSGDCLLGILIIRTWTAVDDCGNSVSFDQAITQWDGSIQAQIVLLECTATNITLWSHTANTWAVQPEYCTNLTSTPAAWVPILPFDNVLQTSTNMTSFGYPLPDTPELFLRVLQIPP